MAFLAKALAGEFAAQEAALGGFEHGPGCAEGGEREQGQDEGGVGGGELNAGDFDILPPAQFGAKGFVNGLCMCSKAEGHAVEEVVEEALVAQSCGERLDAGIGYGSSGTQRKKR